MPDKFPLIEIDHSVVMPNHFHGNLLLDGEQTGLSMVAQWLKTMTTNAYIRGVNEHGWTPFELRLWQRSFHDHIIRDARGLAMIRQYIETNPARWNDDAF